MKTKQPERPRGTTRGFALVLTLVLLALLVLLVHALAALVRVDARLAAMAMYQTRARQNARLGLGVALGELQRYAGPDDRITAMAGVTGVAPGNSLRQWTGVWGAAPEVIWLASGAGGGGLPSIAGERVILVGPNTVGNPTDRTDQEIVEVGLVEVPAGGRLAYWVGDEGVKVSAIMTDAELQSGGSSGTGLRPNPRRLISTAFVPTAPANARVLGLEQIRLSTTGYSLAESFHSLTRLHRALPSTAPDAVAGADGYVAGAFNLNTTSEAAWRAWLEFPRSTDSVFGLNSTRTLSAARQIRDRLAARGQPFDAVAGLLASGLIQDAFDHSSPRVTTITQEDFLIEIGPVLAVRSDTFRIRAYGEALNPVPEPGQTSGVVEARAWVEAIVQRTPDTVPGLGRRFVILRFRWLGPEDL